MFKAPCFRVIKLSGHILWHRNVLKTTDADLETALLAARINREYYLLLKTKK